MLLYRFYYFPSSLSLCRGNSRCSLGWMCYFLQLSKQIFEGGMHHQLISIRESCAGERLMARSAQVRRKHCVAMIGVDTAKQRPGLGSTTRRHAVTPRWTRRSAQPEVFAAEAHHCRPTDPLRQERATSADCTPETQTAKCGRVNGWWKTTTIITDRKQRQTAR